MALIKLACACATVASAPAPRLLRIVQRLLCGGVGPGLGWHGASVDIRGDIMQVVICGGGVIGACIAYFLARRGIDVIVIGADRGGGGGIWQGWRISGARLVRRHPAR
jgi:NADPH-dependent 2,4-dienoyl-CoA reductase/sulfur reductase-like enzyme